MNNGFPLIPLKEVVKPIERLEIPTTGKIYRQIGVRLWGGGAYERESIDGSQTRYQTFSCIEKDDIIVNKIWARNGSVAVVTQALAGCYGSSEFPTFEPNRAKLEPRWFNWLTKTKNFWEKCDDKSQGTSGKNRIRPEQFLEITIPLPPLEEQQRIVARSEELATRIEEARGLREIASENTKRVPDNELAEIYEALVNKSGSRQLSDILTEAGYGTSNKCLSDRKTDAVPVLRIPNVISERIDLNNMKYGVLDASELKRVLVAEGDLLVVRTNGSADLVGRCAVIPALHESTAFASYLIRLRCNSDIILSDYFQLMLRHLRSNGKLFDFARTTAGQYNVSLGRLRAVMIPVPPLSEQRRIVTYLDYLQAKVDSLKQLQAETQAELDSLLPSILDKAFKGELV